jgi:hypothetical protein
MREDNTQRFESVDLPLASPSAAHDASAESSVVGIAGQKACCVCGCDLMHKTRFKDSTGRYWCPNCNQKDELAKVPADCPDCNNQFPQAELMEFKGVPVCKECWEKRRVAARREEARLRAVEEEVQAEKRRNHRLAMIAIIVGAVVLLGGAIFLALWS